MVIEAEQVQVQVLLKEAITRLCKEGFTFRNSLSIAATINVILDGSDPTVMKVIGEVTCDLGNTDYDIPDAWEEETDDCTSGQLTNCQNNLMDSVKVEEHRQGQWIQEFGWQLPTPKISSVFHQTPHGQGHDSSFGRHMVLTTPVYQPNMSHPMVTGQDSWSRENQGQNGKSWDLVHGLENNQDTQHQTSLISGTQNMPQPNRQVMVTAPGQNETKETEMNLLKSVRALCDDAMDEVSEPSSHVSSIHTGSGTETDTLPGEMEACSNERPTDQVDILPEQYSEDQKPSVSNLAGAQQDENFTRNEMDAKMPNVSLHKQGKEYKCTFCMFVTDHGSAMSRHLTIHQKEPLKCDKCTKEFTCPSALRIHANTTHQRERTCKYCSEKFTCHKDLLQHHRQHHGVSRTGSVVTHCPHCKYSSKNSANMQRHLKGHCGTKARCRLCSVEFADVVVLKKHLKEKHQQEKLSCDVCSKEFKGVKALKKHKKTHPKEEVRETLQCSGCDFTTLSTKSLEKHTKDTTDNLACKFCSRDFVCKNEKRRHMAEEHSLELRKKACEFCSKEFHSRQGLYTHRKVVHGNEMDESKREVFTCHVCGKGFPVHVYLTRHLKSHDSLEPYQCPKCLKTFKYHRNFKSHKDGCLNTEGFQCDVCGKSLKTEYTLKIHVRSMHSDNRTVYPCRQCGTPFSYQQSRNKHERLCSALTLAGVASSVANAGATLEIPGPSA